MWLIGIVIALFLFVTSVILPWVNFTRIRDLERENRWLRSLVQPRQKTAAQEAPPSQPEPATPAPTSPPASPEDIAWPEPPSATPPPAKEAWDFPKTSAKPAAAKPAATRRSPKMEIQFGTRLPVWIGGIALALGGFYLVKYSIEIGLLTPAVRVLLGTLFGLLLLGGGHVIRGQEGFANGQRISQSLSGAGIALLYVSIYAASGLYALIPDLLGFIGMGAVTFAAVFLSLRHGPPIALLGLVGGFLTPALLGSQDPSAAPLFIYLYVIYSALMIVIRREEWWWLAIPSILGCFLWFLVWLATSYTPGDSLWLGLFLIAVSATSVIGSRNTPLSEENDNQFRLTLAAIFHYLGLGGSVILMGFLAYRSGFGFLEWSLFGLLSMGGIGLAFGDGRRYGFVPWLAMAVNLFMLFGWQSFATPFSLAFAIAAFGILFTGSGYILMQRSRLPLLWSGLTAAAALGYYLLAYYRLHDTEVLQTLTGLWGLIALGLAGGAAYLATTIRTQIKDSQLQQYLLAIFTATATAFISLGLAIEMEREFLSVALAGEVLALAWINRRVNIHAMRPITAVVAGVFAFVLLPQILLLIQLSAYSLVGARLHLQDTIPIVEWPWFQLGVPAALFAGAALLLRAQKDGALVRSLELATVALIAVMGYYLSRHAFNLDENILFVKAGFIERGFTTNLLFLFGLGCFWIGRRFDRSALDWSGMALCAIALFRIAYFDLLTLNPLWAHQNVGEWPLINALWLPYGLPILWAWVAGKSLERLGHKKAALAAQSGQLVMLFTLVTLQVRQLFHGAYLDAHTATPLEIYTYSAAWLALGIGLLMGGINRGSPALRYASLAVMILTVGKVFLYDAAELEGLFRVFSFFGLGLCLIGLSYVYTRYVFKDEEQKSG